MGNKVEKGIKICNAFNPNWFSEEDMRAMAKRLPEGKSVALEIGTAFGCSSVFMANANPEMQIYTVDNLTGASLGYGKEKEWCRTVIRRHILDYPNIHFLEADSKKIEWNKLIDFLFIDGDHGYESVKNDFERFSPFVKKGRFVAFHDYPVDRDDVCIKKYVDGINLPVEVEANLAFWENLTGDISKIIEKTKDYFCFGIEEEDLKPRIKFASLLKPDEIIVDFGTGQGRTALTMAMANSKIKVFTFDCGRQDMNNEELSSLISKRIVEQKVENVVFQLTDARTVKWDKEIAGLSIDAESQYEETKIEIEKWFPFVKKGGQIFIQSYNLDDWHKGVKKAVDEYLKEHLEYKLGKLYHNTQVIHKTL